jgi:hypothetical protein
VLLFLGSGPATAAQESEAESDVNPRAMEIIQRMSDFLASAQKLSVTIEMGYDVVQEWGQKIEFGETRRMTIRRPDHIRLEIEDRDGSESGLRFDGQNISVYDLAEKVYATTAKPGTIDGAVAYFVNDLGMRLPMAQIFSPDLPKAVKGWARAVSYVDTSTIAGVACDHLSLRGDWEDVQLWVAKGDRPLLQRMVITYHRAEGEPQFWAHLKDWNLSAELPDSLFEFTPPSGAAKIAFAPLLERENANAGGPKGGKR